MQLNVISTRLPEVLVLEPTIFGDERGFLFESFNARDFHAATGLDRVFVQDNHTCSVKNVLRGLHYQLGHPQGKLIRVVSGEVFDVAVDLRRHSPNFGRWVGLTLSARNRRQLWVPEGFGHGFLVLSDEAEVLYKATDFRCAEYERTVAWNDAQLGIEWPVQGELIMAQRDRVAPGLRDAELFP